MQKQIDDLNASLATAKAQHVAVVAEMATAKGQHDAVVGQLVKQLDFTVAERDAANATIGQFINENLRAKTGGILAEKEVNKLRGEMAIEKNKITELTNVINKLNAQVAAFQASDAAKVAAPV